MEATFASREARIFVIDDSGPARQLLSSVVRSFGFTDITVFTSVSEVIKQLERDTCDWLITSSQIKQSVNAFQFLKLTSNVSRLRSIRTSLFVEKNEESFLPEAFQLGLMSWHEKPFQVEKTKKCLQDLIKILARNQYNSILVAADYLQMLLSQSDHCEDLIEIQKTLLEMFPGSVRTLLRLGEAHLKSGNTQEGMGALYQARLIDENTKPLIDKLTEKYTNSRMNSRVEGAVELNTLGISTCVLIDPDTAVLGTIKNLLSQVGVSTVYTFEAGDDAWEWLMRNVNLDLIIMEWRIPGLAGPLLLQRLRQHGLSNVPINVISSVIDPKEAQLLREFGVDNVLAKPFSASSFFKAIAWTLQQNLRPTEQVTLDLKIRRLLAEDKIEEAERLKMVYLSNKHIKTASKKHLEGEFLYRRGEFGKARDTAIEAMKLSGDSLCLLNLVGKCLLKLSDYTAAARVFEKLRTLSPSNIEHLCHLALSHTELGSTNQALGALEKAKGVDRNNILIKETECQVHILSGDVNTAQGLMEQLESIESIMSYMNNRAIALTRSGRYEDGIELYRRTAASIPERMAEKRDAVLYNLGLAYARYGDLTLAMSTLEVVANRHGSRVAKKAASLQSRVKDVIQSKLPALPLHEPISRESDLQSNTQEPISDQMPKLGELCLYGIYRRTDRDSMIGKLLKQTPQFSDKIDS